MNASIAIQVLPKVATNEETISAVDEVIGYIVNAVSKLHTNDLMLFYIFINAT